MANKSGRPAKSKPKVAPKKRSTKKPLAVAPLDSQPAKLASVFRITKQASLTLWRHRKLFLGIVLIYAALDIILVQGLSNSTNITSLKTSLSQIFHGRFSGLDSGLTIFVLLIGSAGSSNSNNQASGAYELIVGIIVSLAIIWALRQAFAGAQVRVRDAFYKGMYPLIQFSLVLIIMGLQLIPLVVGSALYGLVLTNGYAVLNIEKLIWTLVFLGLASLSVYFVTSSIFALYIVSLAGMTPFKAVRSASGIVKGRRWLILRKLLFLPLALIIAAALILLPIIAWVPGLAPEVLLSLSIFGLLIVHSYLYTFLQGVTLKNYA